MSVNADTYFWDFGNGDTDTTANPVYEYSQSGMYQVMLQSSQNCKIDTVIDTVQVVISSKADVVMIKHINIYPNPGKGNYYFKNNTINSDAQISITDIFGNVIFYDEKSIQFGEVEIITNLHLEEGVYLCI